MYILALLCHCSEEQLFEVDHPLRQTDLWTIDYFQGKKSSPGPGGGGSRLDAAQLSGVAGRRRGGPQNQVCSLQDDD